VGLPFFSGVMAADARSMSHITSPPSSPQTAPNPPRSQ
jgi:hypothetical protein